MQRIDRPPRCFDMLLLSTISQDYSLGWTRSHPWTSDTHHLHAAACSRTPLIIICSGGSKLMMITHHPTLHWDRKRRRPTECLLQLIFSSKLRESVSAGIHMSPWRQGEELILLIRTNYNKHFDFIKNNLKKGLLKHKADVAVNCLLKGSFIPVAPYPNVSFWRWCRGVQWLGLKLLMTLNFIKSQKTWTSLGLNIHDSRLHKNLNHQVHHLINLKVCATTVIHF